MVFNPDVSRSGNAIPGAANRRFGGSIHSSPVLLTTPLCHDYSSTHWGTTYYGGGRHGLLGGGITLLVLGVALTALGIFSFVLRDPAQGVTFTAAGGLGVLAGIACLIACFAMRKIN